MMPLGHKIAVLTWNTPATNPNRFKPPHQARDILSLAFFSVRASLPLTGQFATKTPSFPRVQAHVSSPPTIPTRDLLTQEAPRYLSRGRAANADVRLLEVAGQKWVVKDFSACPWWVRELFGPWMISRELYALQLLQGISGVPQQARRIDRQALTYHFIEGSSLSGLERSVLTVRFFEDYERLVTQMHERGIAHLDLRNSGNVLYGSNGKPILIDFQSWLKLPRWLPFFARFLCRIDLSGVYKLWNGYLPGTMGSERQAVLDSVNRLRKGWIFSNYMGLRHLFKERK